MQNDNKTRDAKKRKVANDISHVLKEHSVPDNLISTLDIIGKQFFKKYAHEIHKAIFYKKASIIQELVPTNKKHLLWIFLTFFPNKIAFFDIETTSLWGDVTTITIFDGISFQSFVKNKNLEDFKSAFEKYDILVSFNGKAFDMPFLERFNWKFHGIHLDLRWMFSTLRKWNLMPGCVNGKLKTIENYCGQDRGMLTSINGEHAPWFWSQYIETKNEDYLNLLLAYNCQDTVNLPKLLEIAYNELCDRYGLKINQWTVPSHFKLVKIPFDINPIIIQEIQHVVSNQVQSGSDIPKNSDVRQNMCKCCCQNELMCLFKYPLYWCDLFLQKNRDAMK